jgi:threonine/homoserine/homoserine lactone efflux protein
VFAFIWYVIGVSLSGVMAPGPVTAATLATGTRNRHSGLLIAVGHGIVEFPLMMIIVAGMGAVFKFPTVGIIIGMVGGAFLLHMGGQMLSNLHKQVDTAAPYSDRHPVWIGVALTITNPYFLFWWATVGATLSMEAKGLGPTAFILFAVLHWLCDAVWLEILSQASFHGTQVLGRKTMPIILTVCAAALIVIGSLFVRAAGKQAIEVMFPEKYVFPESRPASAPATHPASQPASTAVAMQWPPGGRDTFGGESPWFFQNRDREGAAPLRCGRFVVRPLVDARGSERVA